jgi:hypothetical protein
MIVHQYIGENADRKTLRHFANRIQKRAPVIVIEKNILAPGFCAGTLLFKRATVASFL